MRPMGKIKDNLGNYEKMHALTQTYDHSVVMPIWLVLTCEVPGKN